MKNKFGLIFLLLLAVWFLSCDRPECKNQNKIFDNNEPNSELYKKELAKQFNNVDRSKLRYWLQKYEEQNEKESLYFYIQGDNLCAILNLSVTNWDKLENVRERKGVGRRGAEFTNLKFRIIQDSISTKFVYSTFDKLID